MDQNILNITLTQLANLLFLPVVELETMLEKHGIKEIRQRSFFWVPFIWVCFKCILNGKTRHKDRVGLYKKLFEITLSGNAFSDRFSQLPPAFYQELLKKIQPKLNQIGSPCKRDKIKRLIYNISAEDASVFHLDSRLVNLFKAIPGCNSAGLKLYANVNIVGETRFDAKIKNSRSSDTKHKSPKAKNRTIEVRDRGWFSWTIFSQWKSENRYFISRIQKQINPQVVGVYQGDFSWKKKRFRDLNLEGHKEIDLLIKPYRDSKGSIFRLKDGSVFTLRLKGRKCKDGQWYWYVFHLPEARLSFEDVHSLYRARWRIEELFREIKQAFGGDHIRLRHPNSVVNHILIMIIAYLICKGYLKKIAYSHRKSVDGFTLDICFTGSLRELLKEIIFALAAQPNLTGNELKNLSQAFCESGYSMKRARSYQKSSMGKALKKLETNENTL